MTIQIQLAQGILPYTLEIAPDADATVTAYAGLPLVLETLRSLRLNRGYRRLAAALEIRHWKVVRRHVESLVLLIAAGGECIDDLLHLRADAGLKALLRFEPSSPTQAKEFLYLFHQAEDGRALTDDDDAELSSSGQARIRPEGPGLRVLATLLDAVIARVQRLQRRTSATLDVDATIIEAHKRRALLAYEGTRGYQPQMAWWAEQRVWVCDEFRDGNVPAAYAAKAYLQKAFGVLPASVTTRRLRGDSALYDQEALTWADDQGIEFAVSADMSEALQKEVVALPEPAWHPYRSLRDDATEERQWAEVVFVPGWPRNRKREGQPLRYLAIRVRSKQRDLLLDDAARWRHFAVVTNMTWDGERLLRWQREKQGTVEHGHGILKNELAGGTLPCGRFGANAAWWRINVLVHDLLTLLQTVLPEPMQSARPKALRFRLLNVAGHIVRHARTLVLRLSSRLPAARIYAAARQALLDLVAAGPPEPQGP
jgi:hypothetical protein